MISLSSALFSVPPRREYRADLLARLDEAPTKIIMDERGEGLWPTARRAWMATDQARYSHHLVMQDDIRPARDFIATARKLAGMYPESIISLYSNRKAGREALAEGRRWFRFRDCTFGQALLMPTPLVNTWLLWEAEHIRSDYKWDDARLGAFCSEFGIDIHATVPALCQHMAPADSSIGISNRRRVTSYFFDDHFSGSPLALDWTEGWPGPLTGRGKKIYEDALI